MKHLPGIIKKIVRFVILALTFIIFIVVSGFFSCKKNKEINLNPNVDAANDVVMAESNLRFVFDLLLKAEKDSLLWKTGNSQIDSSSVLADTLTRMLYFDFSSIECPDSIVRTGRIMVSYQGRLFHKGYHSVVTFVNYVVDINPYSGTYTLNNRGLNDKKAWEVSVDCPDGAILKMVDGASTTYTCQSMFVFDSVSALTNSSFSWYMIGELTGRGWTGYPVSATIPDSLIASMTCPWIVSGKINMTVSGAEITDGYIDFIDDGKCNPKTIYNFGGNIFYNTGLKHYQH